MYNKQIKAAVKNRGGGHLPPRYIMAFIIILAVTLCVIFGISVHKKLSYKYYYKGIFVDGIKISGLTKEKALDVLENEFSNKYPAKTISLIYQDNSWKITLIDIDYRYDFETTLNYAYAIGRQGNIFDRLKAINNLKKTPVNLITPSKYDIKRLDDILKKIKKDIDYSGISSTYDYNYGKIKYTGDTDGRFFDMDTNSKLIRTRLLNRNFDDISLIVQIQKPSITVEDVKDIRDTLGSYTTKFNSGNYSRAHNIELAGKKINNYLLKPGEEFSMDSALGPRTAQFGFMQAPIIMKSEVVPGTGGGVCQVASTLYNAVLLSRLQVTSRVNHSIALSYVPPGQDATISEGYIDLKFKNNRDYTICIVSQIKDGILTVKIIGKRAQNEGNAVLRPVIVQEYDPPDPEYAINDSLSDGDIFIKTHEKKGLKVILYRDIYNQQGELIDSEKISQDIYKPIRGVLIVNKKTFEYLKSRKG